MAKETTFVRTLEIQIDDKIIFFKHTKNKLFIYFSGQPYKISYEARNQISTFLIEANISHEPVGAEEEKV